MGDYIIYREGERRLKESGLTERINKLYDFDKSPYFGNLMEFEIPNYIDELKERGYFKTLPKNEIDSFKAFINGVFTGKKEVIWKVNGKSRKVEYLDRRLEQLIMFAGFHASSILSPEEIWDFQKFGFDSMGELVGTVGAKILNSSFSLSEGGLVWTSQNEKRILENVITGDTNSDLRVYQKDLTEYETVDPLGNEVHYRPVLKEDNFCISAYYSTETSFLVGLLKYISQEEIESEVLKNSNQFLNWIDNLSQKGGSCLEHFGRDSSFGPMFHFASFDDVSIPRLDKNMQTKQHSFYGIPNINGKYFCMYIKSDKSLIFSYMGNEKETQSIDAHFYPNDVDNMLKGLFHQCSSGLGRTSVREVKKVLEYYLENHK